ncbi:tripartite motif-containing protein 55-like [Saccostrea echinata]|uniref:tripartite motif-containing protein 55-like n=1 Tax=Saccostrea echinata TaxID=191078 RepID=UPI002A809BFD|nr:tripartite motif-containing protein 55-like [Saccostrea echinata]
MPDRSTNIILDPRTSAQDVMRCDLCETAVVQMHCDTCLVNLCKACVGEHMISDESNRHEIVPFKIRKSTPQYPGCTSHRERCEMYCKQCDIPVCISCIASDQHKRHKFLKILQVLDERKDKIMKDLTELNEIIYPTYQDIVSDVQNRMSQLEKEYGDLSTAITKHGEDWHREIDKLVKKLKTEVDEMKNTQVKTLQKHLDEINKKISNIKDEINSFDVAMDSNDMSKQFSVTSDINKHRNLPEKIVTSLPKFTPGRIKGEELWKLFGALSPNSLTSDKHGYSMKMMQKLPEAGSSPPPVKQLLEESEIVTIINTGYSKYLYNVACITDEEIWISGNDGTMKLYSINQGSLLNSIRTKSRNPPCDIAVTKSGELVYIDFKDRTVNIVKNEKMEEVIRLQNWRPSGVCSTSSGDLLVIMNSDDYKQSKAVCYSGSTEKQTIQFDVKGKALYSSGSNYRNITENRNLDICVSDDGAKAVVVVNQAGKLRFRYTGHTPAPKNEPFSPRGITTDSQSHILTADRNNDCVHIIDQDGQFLHYIDCGLIDPYGLCTDTNDNLFVAQYGNKQVMKIKYLK